MSNSLAIRFAGLLILISTSSFMYADSIIYELLTKPDFLEQAALNRTSLAFAALLEFINCAAVIGMSILIYPTIRQYSERVAIGYVSGRLIEGATLITGAVTLMTLIAMGKQIIDNPDVSSEYLYMMGTALKSERWFGFLMGMFSLGLCGFLLNITLYQYRLIPRAISVLGMVGYAILLLKVAFDYFGVSFSGSWMYIPGGLYELIFPLWMIFKGFDLSAKPKSCS
ncbi:DUF4386 domain-containing protein [Pseudoalteromonas luteoviolacea]|uniref:DUF4386 domain-containing protein n=1 Tax=Pseudoalteromonas luteoviolacea (strain 2ta16) TaxID=1353533 RepID=V4J5K2_PSEL2|nr:DUF4386 domain-containing protein [Pseudoalteromonas luteoviolacea]ESP90627.1 hypothetical protein PL2TA16_01731 [Pseudoalteromonas luteoviolacea 2ta16]KZN41799.1 hypothetical protein N483_14100 [Pseudoalteromonas luteoviolacea NCIMB 1944]